MKLQERLEKAEEVKKEYYEVIKDLPTLKGSEKQISWANDLRNNYINVVNEFIDSGFNKRRLTQIIINLVAVNAMLKNTSDAKFYIDNRMMCKPSYDRLAEHFIHLNVKRPDGYDLSWDYLVDLVRNGTSIEDIKNMLD